MIRRAFVRRMIFAGLATWFLDLPLPQEPERDAREMSAAITGWTERGDPIIEAGPGVRAEYRDGKLLVSHDESRATTIIIGSDYRRQPTAPATTPVKVYTAPGEHPIDDMRRLVGIATHS